MVAILRAGALGLLFVAAGSCHPRGRAPVGPEAGGGPAAGPGPGSGAGAPAVAAAGGDEGAAAREPEGAAAREPAAREPAAAGAIAPREGAGPRVVASASAPATTACRAVAHIGDSTSTGMMSEKYIRDPERRLDRRYAAVGVEDMRLELFGGRSLIEHRPQNENGLMVAARLRDAGFRGCWVIGLGTNDAANVAKDGTVPPAERVDRLMAIVGDDPVLWIDAVTRRSDGYWARENMAAWNHALQAALARHPNATIYAWSAEMQDEWFVKDGIHYTSAGYAARAERVARALAAAFPGDG